MRGCLMWRPMRGWWRRVSDWAALEVLLQQSSGEPAQESQEEESGFVPLHTRVLQLLRL